MKLIFANVSQGFVYADDLEKSTGMVFRKFSIPDYVDYFANHDPDVLCLSEVLIDDSEGNSEFVDKLASATGLKHRQVLRSEESFIYIGKYYGIAILSKYPITNYEKYKLPNPKFEVTRPYGDYWIMHDKYVQHATLDGDGEKFNLFNLHYFPVHHFKKSIDTEEMKPYRKALGDFFTNKGFERPTIITGDFNNKGARLNDVFPELFESSNLKEAIEVETTILDGKDQLDHILYTHDTLIVKDAKAEKYLSDHYALVVEFIHQ